MPAAAPARRSASSALRYPGARVLAFDIALPMVVAARQRSRAQRTVLRRLLRPFAARSATAPAFVCADIDALPFAGVSRSISSGATSRCSG